MLRRARACLSLLVAFIITIISVVVVVMLWSARTHSEPNFTEIVPAYRVWKHDLLIYQIQDIKLTIILYQQQQVKALLTHVWHC